MPTATAGATARAIAWPLVGILALVLIYRSFHRHQHLDGLAATPEVTVLQLAELSALFARVEDVAPPDWAVASGAALPDELHDSANTALASGWTEVDGTSGHPDNASFHLVRLTALGHSRLEETRGPIGTPGGRHPRF